MEELGGENPDLSPSPRPLTDGLIFPETCQREKDRGPTSRMLSMVRCCGSSGGTSGGLTGGGGWRQGGRPELTGRRNCLMRRTARMRMTAMMMMDLRGGTVPSLSVKTDYYSCWIRLYSNNQ